MPPLDITKSSIIFDQLKRTTKDTSWVGHTPFVFYLLTVLKPKLFVELGVHTGVSFSAICQAVKKLKLNTSCYGVDTWKGDQHVGFYDEKIYQELSSYQQENYKDFSHLLKMTFDDALDQFPNKSLDLLHIDGCHTYESVKHDFETWLPKMSERGVILFHDTQVHNNDFGVWKLWSEISSQYTSFEFTHCNGLGVLGVGKHLDATFLQLIDQLSNNVFYPNLFFALGNSIFNDIKKQNEAQLKASYANTLLQNIKAPLRKIKRIFLKK